MGGMVVTPPAVGSIEELKAQVAAFEANPVSPTAPNTDQETTTPATATQESASPQTVVPPQSQSKEKPIQQQQETPEKPVAGTTTVEPKKEVIDWEARYKGLQRKYDKEHSDKKVEPKVEKPEVKPIEDFDDITPEFKKKIAEDLEKDPVETLIRLSRTLARREVMPVKSRLDSAEAQKAESVKLQSIDKLVKEGHEWLLTEDGINKVEAVFDQNPELLNLKDPYRAALGFIPDIPSRASKNSPAPTTGLTPILGASGAMPPGISTPVVSTAEKLMTMQTELDSLIKRGKIAEAKALTEKMDDLQRG